MNNHNVIKLVCLVALCFTSLIKASAQEIPKELYIASSIPDSLKEDANAVVRYSLDEITIKMQGRADIKHHRIVTILNEKGDREAIVQMLYNRKYDSYSNIEIRVFDKDGVQIKKYHKSDMYDGSASNDETLVTDDRFLAIKHTIAAYPTTIEVTYEEELNSFISLSNWYVQETLEESVQNSIYKVLTTPAIGFRYKSKNITLVPELSKEGVYDVYKWKVANVKAIKKEENILSWNVLPRVMFGTNNFNCYGYPGDISSWQNFGNWIQGLNNDVCTLSPQRMAEVKKMTDSIKNDKEKAKFLYKYMQRNMRYVSIQLGIGGFKPFPATFVDEKKYGDCKALANYMRALLKAVGIPSYYAIIRAGYNEEPADPSFPHNAFNHAILCVPFKNDTTWLECTSSTQPFGKLGPFTENRNALLITEEGGRLVNTPKSTVADNTFNSNVRLIINEDGSAKAEVNIFGSGGYRDEYISIASLKLDQQKEIFMKLLNIRQPTTFDIKEAVDKDGVRDVTMELEYDRFYDVASGDKQFYRPRVFDLWALTLPIEEKRRSDFYFSHPMLKTCYTTIELPKGFEVESLPANSTLAFSYGNYEVNYSYNPAKNQVVTNAKFTLRNQAVPAAKYAEMQQYMDNVAKAQNKKLVIKRKA